MAMEKEALYSELLKMREELYKRLEAKNRTPEISVFIKKELKDINKAIEKIENGTFGVCEQSGDEIPEEMLYLIPTIQSKEDLEEIRKYYCKPLY